MTETKQAEALVSLGEAQVVFVSAAKEPWGAERSLSIILQHMTGLGMGTHAVTLTAETSNFLSNYTSTSVVSRPKRSNRLTDLFAMYRLIQDAPKGAVLVIFSLQLLPLLPLLRIMSRGRYRLIADIHDAPRGFFDRAASAFCVRFAHRAVAISKHVSDHLWIGKMCTIVPRPIELTAADSGVNWTVADDDFRPGVTHPVTVGIVGRLDREKRIDLVIRAVGSLSEDWEIRLNVYGAAHLNGGYPSELASIADGYGSSFVEFRGVQPQSVIYEEIDVLVVANENEPSGRSVGEAMIHRVPVITPDQGGAPEYFTDGVSGLVFESGSPESLADSLEVLLSNLSQTRDMISSARTRVAEERNPEAVSQAYVDAITVSETK